MQSIPNPQLYCQLHQMQLIQDICISPTCSNRILCSQCRYEHEKTHLSALISIGEFFSTDYYTKIERLNSMAYQNQKIYQDKLILIDAIVNELKARFEYCLSEFRSNLLKQLSLYDSKVNCDWDLLQAKFYELSSYIEKGIDSNKPQILKRQNEFVDICLDIDKKMSKLKIERGVIQNFISYSDKNMERFTNQAQRMMDEFAYLSNMSKYDDMETNLSSKRASPKNNLCDEDNSSRFEDLLEYKKADTASSSTFAFLKGLFT